MNNKDYKVARYNQHGDSLRKNYKILKFSQPHLADGKHIGSKTKLIRLSGF
jgi:hypothetical protein